jgi:mono/diheme cytochrome c family protein
MSKPAWFISGILFLAAVLAIGAVIFVKSAGGFSAVGQPSGMESWMAVRMRSMSVPSSSKDRPNPIANSPEVLEEARAHWADHCATCHANNGSGNTEMGEHMYPPAPDMRLGETQRMTDGELFFIIENGVRFTGMAAWGGSGHDEQASWKLVRFIRHLPQVTADEERSMEKMNPKGPDDLKEEQEEKEFLNGGQPHEHTSHDHH